MTELICIVCPNSCTIKVGEDLSVTGNLCPRGETYAVEEMQNPVRTLTSTVRIEGAQLRRCPVRSQTPIPKRLLFDAMRLLDSIVLTAPVAEGHIIVEDICGIGTPFVTTRGMEKKR